MAVRRPGSVPTTRAGRPGRTLWVSSHCVASRSAPPAATMTVPDRPCHANEHLVPRRVPPPVVHRLELVDVHQQQREPRLVAEAASGFPFERRFEVIPVEEPGQRIGHRAVLENLEDLMLDDRGSDQVAADIEQVIERRDRQADIAPEPGAELMLMRGDRRGTLRRLALIEPRMRHQAPEVNQLRVARRPFGPRADPELMAREVSAASSALGRCPTLGAPAPVHATAPIETAAVFRARAQGHATFSRLTEACMRDTLGQLRQTTGPLAGRYSP